MVLVGTNTLFKRARGPCAANPSAGSAGFSSPWRKTATPLFRVVHTYAVSVFVVEPVIELGRRLVGAALSRRPTATSCPRSGAGVCAMARDTG